MARLLVTRAEPDLTRTAQVLAASGHTVVAVPLTRIVALDDGLARMAALAIDAGSVPLAVATSARAVEALSDAGVPLDAFRWAVVGARAATLLAEAGAGLMLPAAADVRELADALRERLPPRGEGVLYPCGEDRRSALEEALPGVEAIAVYAARATGGLDAPAAAALAADPPDAGLVYSARSALLLVDALRSACLDNLLPKMRWLCLSPQVGDALTRAVGVPLTAETAQTPDEEALFALIEGEPEAG